MNTYSGLTSVNAGTLNVSGSILNSNIVQVAGGMLQSSNANALSDTAAVTVSGTGTLDLNGTDETIGSLAGADATASVSLGANTLTTGDATDTSFAGGITGTGGLTKQGAGTFTLAGTNTYTGVTMIDAGTLALTGGAAIVDTGEIQNGGTLQVDQAETVGSVNGAGGITLNADLTTGDAGDDTISGVISGTGALTKQGAGTLTLSGVNTYSGLTSVNAGTLNNNNSLAGSVSVADGAIFNNNASVAGGLSNGGITNLANGTSILGAVTNDGGTINATGATTVGSLDNTGGTVSLANGLTTDVLTITGATVGGGGNVNLEVDLSDNAGGVSGNADRIIATGGASGAVTLNLTTVASGGLQTDPTVVASNGAGTTVSVTGLPTTGAVVYTLEELGSDLVIQNQVNPAVAGVSGSVNLVQSLIGTVVNRPTSPFVGGLYSQEGGDCGAGAWSRAVGGTLSADGKTSNGVTSTVNNTDINYGGIQIGGDWGCFNGSVNGWDMAVGGFLGLNTGSSTQTVSLPTGVNKTDTDFDQTYAGIYLSGARGAFTFDLQLRGEDTDYEITDPSLGLNQDETNNKGLTFSGSASYAIPVNESDLTFIPTIGFGITENETDSLVLGSGDLLEFEDFQTRTGFVGATLAKTRISATGLAATNLFGTATVYTDFDRSRESFFTSGGGSTQTLVTEGIGTFGEVSVGFNHVRILDGTGSTNARQLSASARLDYRFNSDIDSVGLTAQVRLQF